MNDERTATSLAEIITVDSEKCMKCNACIRACPTHYCNMTQEDDELVRINPDLCIGCGECLKACSHGARTHKDDLNRFLADLENGVPLYAIVAPAAAAEFKGRQQRLNGWLKQAGVQAVFDVSFGAELTVKSYMDYIENNTPECVIAQPCPAIVSYIELYQPELLPYLIPADSPMLHTIKMVNEYYPENAGRRCVVISPCIAKKREFEATGMGDYNVTMSSLKEYFDKMNIDLESFDEVEYDNPPAERAVLFSCAGGLLETAKRWSGSIDTVTRKIEGVSSVYDYLSTLKKDIDRKEAPLLIDCLNCEKGCNGGTGTTRQDETMDHLESLVKERSRSMKEHHRTVKEDKGTASWKAVNKLIEQYWKPGLYDRRYVDRSANFSYKKPDNRELKETYTKIDKFDRKDIYNCGACGYDTCEMMAFAIFNGLNYPKNCHHYLIEEIGKEHKELLRQEQIFDQLSTPVFCVDREMSISYINAEVLRMTGYKQEQIIGVKCSDIFHTPHCGTQECRMTRMFKNGKPQSGRTEAAIGDIILPVEYHVSPLKNEEGEIVGGIEHIIDISERINFENKLQQQNKLITEISTPAINLWDGILVLPVVGIIDSARAQMMLEKMLEAILSTSARIAILDISGVASVDTAVSNHLIKITKATKLMGCECVISGISPSVAQSIVQLGIDLSTINTKSNLNGALSSAFRMLDLEVVPKGR